MASRIIENQILKEKVFHRNIDPGFDAYVLPKKGFKKKYAIIATNFGSIDSQFSLQDKDEIIKVPDGVAHFLEHKLFEYEGGTVTDDFSRLGMSSNAFTNFTNTAYLFSCTENFEEGITLLLDFVQDPYFTKESVEKEKGIIEQEIRMYDDNPQWRIFFNLLNALYKDHPVKIDIAGTVGSIRDIDAEVLHTCYNTFYHPSNMAFFAVGDFESEEVLDFVESNITKRNYSSLGEIKRFYPKEPTSINSKKVTEKLSVSLPLFYLGFKDNNVGFTGEKLFRKEILTDLILDIIFSPSSQLYNDLYEEGLIDENFSASFVGQKGYGHVIIGGETKDPDKLYEKIIEGINKEKREGINKESFERQKNKLMGEFLKDFNSLEFIANNYLAYQFKDINIFDYINILDQVSIKEVEERLEELLQDSNHAVSIIEPE